MNKKAIITAVLVLFLLFQAIWFFTREAGANTPMQSTQLPSETATLSAAGEVESPASVSGGQTTETGIPSATRQAATQGVVVTATIRPTSTHRPQMISPTPRVENKATITRTATLTLTSTSTPTPTSTLLPTYTATRTPTGTSTHTPTSPLTPTNAATITPPSTLTPTSAATITPPSTLTPTSTASNTPTETATPTSTNTATPT